MNYCKKIKSHGLYIHTPFCRSKCPYCAFFSVASTSLVPRWLNALEKEISFCKDSFNRFDSLYLGGGTPTVLGSSTLVRIMDVISTHFTFESDSEITIEANPGDLEQDKIKALRDAGFNRISLGVQSFDDGMLSFLGRGHTVGDTEKAIKKLRSHGFENISMDLIYGVKGQQRTEWIKTLRRALSFRPEHLSCYQLTIEPKTRFGRLRDRGLIRPLSEKEEKDIFLATSQFLEDNGYIHYEISSFARKDGYYSRHNCKYWQHTPYLGLGPSAHSFDGFRRWWNVRSVRKYCENLEKGKTPVEGLEELTSDQLQMESILLGLRTKYGFDKNILTYDHRSHRMLQGLRASGHVVIDNDTVLPTRKGFLVADYLAACFGG